MNAIKKMTTFFNTVFSRFLHFWRGLINKNPTLTNPYVKGAEGQHAWNDRYGNLQASVRCWRLACFAASLVSLVLAGVVADMATSAKVQPFVVETHEGMPYAVSPMQGVSAHDQRLINFAINQFIINARTVVQDPPAQKNLIDKVYAYAANQTLAFLHDYYQAHNPFDIAARSSITVTIVSSLPMSANTWQVMWDETEHNTVDENSTRVTRFIATLTYQFGDVNPDFMLANPFGLYVTQLAWSPVLRGA